MKIPELLAPAGNLEKVVTALHFGADAVYMGLSDFSLRAKADNFTPDELKHAADYIKKRDKKLYITVNIFPHNRDITPIRDHLDFLKRISPDALIISDLGVFELAASVAPGIPVHISTQANITNYRAAQFWEKSGAKRIVLSRELTIDEIREIRDEVSIELECFVHGSICVSYSGRCYISSFMANRSANLGECTNSCRWNYTLMEEKRPDEYNPVYENDRGTYLLSSKDLCMIEHLDKLSDAGIDSFKLEGRMKGVNYVAGVVKTYREAVDSLADKSFKVKNRWLRELSMLSNRGYTTGMYLSGHPDEGYNHDETETYRMSHELVGIVRSVTDGKLEVILRNNLKIGDRIEFLSTGSENNAHEVKEMRDIEGRPIVSARNEETVLLPARPGIKEKDLIRRPLSQG